MTDTKNFLTSLGIMGPLVALVVWGANHFFPGLGLLEADVSGIIDGIATVVGLVTGIYGRFKATKIVTLAPQ